MEIKAEQVASVPTPYGFVSTGPSLIPGAQKQFITIVDDNRYANEVTGERKSIVVEAYATFEDAALGQFRWLVKLLKSREELPVTLEDRAEDFMPPELVPILRPKAERNITLMPAIQ